MGDVFHRLLGELRDGLGGHLQERALWCLEGGDALGADEAICGLVSAQGEQLGELEISHGPTVPAG
ncbi:unannotated protein [freshwater metagenome]|uniref:Unannotated protein n=1 Tax=freshwater metagenome TaxID=449393 RepID=A0A6J6YTJ1_9ZZZZ